MNKALFDSVKDDLTSFGNRIDLSNVYNAGTLTTATKTITDTFNGDDGWQVNSDKEIYYRKSGLKLTASGISGSHYMKLFVDGDPSTYGFGGSGTLTINMPYTFKLKSISAKIGVASSKYMRLGTVSGLSSGTYQNFSCSSDGTDTSFSFSSNTTTQNSFYMAGRAGTSASASSSNMYLYDLHSITYDTSCNVVTYPYTATIADGTVIKVRTPSNINTAIPTIFKVGNYEVSVGLATADTDYELIYRNSALTISSQVRNISVKTGVVSHNDIIPQTPGYNHYVYMVSPTMSSYVSAYYTYELRMVGYRIVCEVDQVTRKVTSVAYVEISSSNSGSPTVGSQNIQANYIEIAWN